VRGLTNGSDATHAGAIFYAARRMGLEVARVMFGGRRRDRGRRVTIDFSAVPLPRNLAFCRATPVATVPELTQNPSIQLNERV
jgi:hypothetical protein